MKCDICGKEATHSITEKVGEDWITHHFCKEHYKDYLENHSRMKQALKFSESEENESTLRPEIGIWQLLKSAMEQMEVMSSELFENENSQEPNEDTEQDTFQEEGDDAGSQEVSENSDDKEEPVERKDRIIKDLAEMEIFVKRVNLGDGQELSLLMPVGNKRKPPALSDEEKRKIQNRAEYHVLKQKLEECILEEDYEECTRIRDRISELEAHMISEKTAQMDEWKEKRNGAKTDKSSRVNADCCE